MKNNKIRLADSLFKYLAALGVKNVFQVTGRGSLFLSDALAVNNDINSVSLHHEQSCGFAALASSKTDDRLGVCLLSTGCASTNALTPLLNAWQDSSPVLFISGQNHKKLTSSYTRLPLRTFGEQEADISTIASSICKRSVTLHSTDNFSSIFYDLIHSAFSGRPGPVWLDIPLDIQCGFTIHNDSLFSNFQPYLKEPDTFSLPEDFKIKLTNSKRPIILVGSGIRFHDSINLLLNFCTKYSIPIVSAKSASSLIPTSYPYFLGSVGSMGCSRHGNFALANSDFVIVLGSSLNSPVTGKNYDSFCRDALITVVDIDEQQHLKNGIRIDFLFNNFISVFLECLSSVSLSDYSDWSSKCVQWKTLLSTYKPCSSSDGVDLYDLSSLLSETVPENSQLVVDSGYCDIIIPTNVNFPDSCHLIQTWSQGCMGFAIPASVGAYLTNKLNTIVIVGDGSFMMNMQELESIRHLKLPIKIIVISNGMYSIIRDRQSSLFRGRTIGTDPSNGVSSPDFRQLSNLFEFEYSKADDLVSLSTILPQFFASKSPFILEVSGQVDQNIIALGSGKSSISRKFINFPIEDPEPLLPRDLFHSQMIINPIS